VDYDLPYSGQASLRVYNALGQVVRVLVNGEVPAGSHRVRWDGKDAQERSVSSGVYFYALETKTGSMRKKVVVVR
jgi:flagellar hook assembly protein FlgD